MKTFKNLRKAELENEWQKNSHDVADCEIFVIVQRLQLMCPDTSQTSGNFSFLLCVNVRQQSPGTDTPYVSISSPFLTGSIPAPKLQNKKHQLEESKCTSVATICRIFF
jgi:hypothetical protein